jgi:hypothetical protein
MSRIRAAVVAIALIAPILVAAERQTRGAFRVEETTIPQIHASMKSGGCC